MMRSAADLDTPNSGASWEALAAAMTFDYDEEKITFGRLLDSLAPSPAEAQTS